MKHCSLCKVDIDASSDFCPLCHNAIQEKSKKTTPDNFPEFIKQKPKSKKQKIVTKVFVILTAAILIACAGINISTKTPAWSVTVALSLFYIWVLVAHTIISRATPFKKVFFQLFSIIALLTSTNIIFGGNAWLTNFVYPSVAMFASAVMTMIVFCSKQRKKMLFGFVTIFVILLLVSLAFLIFGLDTYQSLNIINIVVQSFIVFGYLLFGFKTITSEASRKFHI